MQNLFRTDGVLHYDRNFKVVIDVDPGIAHFYRSLIPKWIKNQPQKYRTHVTVVRGKFEIPKNLNLWGKREGEKIEVFYDPYVFMDRKYFWLKVYSDEIGEIREELGLSRERDRFKGYHITIANRKEL